MKSKIIGPPLELIYLVGFFDGATSARKGGAGVLLAISKVHSFHIKLGCGSSTNTKPELLALWVLLYWANFFGIPYLHIFGDSSIIINWALGMASLSYLVLDNWCETIRQMMPKFLSLEFQHVYIEHNQTAGGFSKEALDMDSGLCHIFEFYDDYVI